MKKKRIVLFSLFLVYVSCILFITLLSRERSFSRLLVLDLFYTYQLWFKGSFTQREAIMRNIALFLPFGYLVSALLPSSGKGKRVAITVMIGFAFSILIESIQYNTGRGMADADDLFNNLIGTVIGAVLYMVVSEINWQPLRTIIPIFLIIAGGIGCYQMSKMVNDGADHTRQFWFEIDSVSPNSFSGSCYTYGRVTPKYSILLRGGNVSTEIDGDRFTAIGELDPTKEYKVLINFTGYGTMSIGTYLYNGKVKYVFGDELGLDDPFLDGAVLKAHTSKYDSYVYEKDGTLIWLLPSSIDDKTEIIYHIHTDEPEKLPEHRIQYAFDNKGFKPTARSTPESDKKLIIDNYRVYIRHIPTEYNVTSITVGFNPGGGVVWSSSFRP